MFTPSYHGGVIKDLIDDIPESDFDVQLEGQVEIIGWLYQYYNEEPHNFVVNINGGTVKTNDIPAATQLFTTDWVVRYMVDNSLGKYYLERNIHSELAKQLEFLLPDNLNVVSEDLDVTKIKVIDNAMGSGHILVYAFDVLMKMYFEQGYSAREASIQILKNNLFGLEIDKRAYQLAYFALLMKAREYNRRALTSDISPNVYVFEDTSNIGDNYFENLPISKSEVNDLQYIVSLFRNSRTLGSIIQIDNPVNTDNLRMSLANVPQDTLLDLDNTREITNQLLRLLNVVEIMQNKYEAVITNPPYLNKMNKTLKDYVKTYYKDYSSDLFSVFIWHNINMTVANGYAAYMTPFVWMFIKSYEKLRISILNSKLISSLIQMEYSAFEEATVPINTFVLKNTTESEDGVYIKLSDFKGGMDIQKTKVLEAIEQPNVDFFYRTNQSNFKIIPGSPIAYWSSEHLFKTFEYKKLDSVFEPRVGLITGDTSRFLRLWFEVQNGNINFHAKRGENTDLFKWYPYQKGGSFRKWYGNNEFIINWKNDGYEIKEDNYSGNRVKSHNYNGETAFKKSVVWTKISSSFFASRIVDEGFLFDDASPYGSVLDDGEYILGLLNSKVADNYLQLMNPTLNFLPGDVRKIPLNKHVIHNELINNLTKKTIYLSKEDWDSFETSWDFTKHPLIQHIDEHNRNWNGFLKQNHCNVPILSQIIFLEEYYG